MFFLLISQYCVYLCLRLNRFTDTLGFQLEAAGFFGGLPYFLMGILLIISGYLADLCRVKKYLTTTQVRKYFNCGGK